VSAPDLEAEKLRASVAAAELVQDGMTVGLGTGSTVAHFLRALAERHLKDLRCVSTSRATEEVGAQLGLPVEPFEQLSRLDIAVDGADEVDPDGWLIKGGGGAHTREKIVAAAADRFVVIADSTKVVDRLSGPVPLELLRFGLPGTLQRLTPVHIREGAPSSPDNGVIADYVGEIGDPAELSARLASTPGVVDHGIFPPSLVHDVLIARGDDVEHRTVR
jgi:ribose 5-phosphate isomerase A